MIQTIDTPKLARRLNASDKSIEVMIEAKLSEEQSKAGADPSEYSGVDRGSRRVSEFAVNGPDDDAAMDRRR